MNIKQAIDSGVDVRDIARAVVEIFEDELEREFKAQVPPGLRNRFHQDFYNKGKLSFSGCVKHYAFFNGLEHDPLNWAHGFPGFYLNRA